MSAQEEATGYASPLTRADILAQYARAYSTPEIEVTAHVHGDNSSATVLIQQGTLRFVDVYLTAGHSAVTIVGPDHKAHRHDIMEGLVELHGMLG